MEIKQSVWFKKWREKRISIKEDYEYNGKIKKEELLPQVNNRYS